MATPPQPKRQRLNGEEGAKDVIAFLGPIGTYGHRAATCFIRYLNLERATLQPCKTMRAAYESMDAQYIVLPIENTIHGVVRETLDCLLSVLSKEGPPAVAENGPPQIIADLVMPVRHALVAMDSAKLKDIRVVRSHEQALGQCAGWLKANVADAERVPWSSTAAAAASILREDNAELAKQVAAICSPSADTLENGSLRVLAHDIQDYPDNFTRFLLLSRKASVNTPSSPDDPLSLRPERKFYALSDWSGLPNITARHPVISSIHTRPMEIIHPSLSLNGSGGRTNNRTVPTTLSRDQTGCWQWALIEVEAEEGTDAIEGSVFLGTLDRRITSQEVIDAEYDAIQALDSLA